MIDVKSRYKMDYRTLRADMMWLFKNFYSKKGGTLIRGHIELSSEERYKRKTSV